MLYLSSFDDVDSQDIEVPSSQLSVKYNPSIGITLENSPALVLNADFTPLSHLPLSLMYWQDAIRTVLSGKADVLAEYNLRVRSVSCEFTLPSVISLKVYQVSLSFFDYHVKLLNTVDSE